MNKSPVLRIAALGDTHCSAREEFLNNFKTALSFIKKEGVDVITFAGDLCDVMTRENARLFETTLTEFLGADCPELVFAIGNHDFWPNLPSYSAPFRRATSFFKRHTGQNVNSHRVIGGYHFITLAPDTDELSYKNFIPWLARQLKEANRDCPEKPIFLISHGRSKDDNYPSERVTYDHRSASRELYDALKPYPNLIHLVGHTHMSILDETAILQNDFTTIDCGCTAFIVPSVPGLGVYSFTPMGLILDVYEDEIVVNRLRLTDGKVLKSPWKLSLPAVKENFPYRKNRFASLKPAKFLSKDVTYVRDEAGCSITFPRASGEDYVECYRVTIQNKASLETTTEYVGFAFYDGMEVPSQMCTFHTKNISSPGPYAVTIEAKYASAHFSGDKLQFEVE